MSNGDIVGKAIKKSRATMGLTQEQFAPKLGVTFSTVSRCENGRGSPSPLALRRIGAMRSKLRKE